MKRIKTLKLNYEFKNVFDKGHYSLGSQVIAHYRINKLGYNRLGIGVSTKVAKAVKRNRIKRVVRNCYQKINKQYGFNMNGEGYDFVFIWNKNSNLDELSYKIIYKDILNTFKYIKNKSENEAKPEK